MDISGFNWIVIGVIGVIGVVVLGLAIAFARLSNRKAAPDSATEEATRRVYEDEERAHHGESDSVP